MSGEKTRAAIDLAMDSSFTRAISRGRIPAMYTSTVSSSDRVTFELLMAVVVEVRVPRAKRLALNLSCLTVAAAASASEIV